MARITHVKAAQQRYKMVPVLDDQGNPTYRTQQLARASKRGKTEYKQQITREDRTSLVPPLTCDHCREPIVIGTPYKWVKTKNTYGGTRHNRHESCPSWQPWELSNSVSARVAQILNDHSVPTDWEVIEDLEAEGQSLAEEVRSLAEEKTEAADSLEEGFGHETSQSAEIREVADSLEGWADELEQIDFPEQPETDCETCEGHGTLLRTTETIDGPEEVETGCAECKGTGQTLNTDALDTWREEAEQALQDAMDNNPI